MNRSQCAADVVEALRKIIKRPTTELRHVDPYQLLVAVVLSAQCTDERVNLVTPDLFRAFPTVKDMGRVESEEILPFIRSISYPNSKSRHLSGLSRMIVNDFGGAIPETVRELKTLPGVGQKTAQVVASVAFGVPTLAVDTHIFRVSNRIGLVRDDAATPDRVERSLKRLFPRDDWGEVHHLLILHGRYTCTARKPACRECVVSSCCAYKEKLDRLPAPLEGLDPSRGRFFCATRRHYFDDSDLVTDRSGVEQVSCPRCGSMNVFLSKSGETVRRIKDYRV
ncbi:MAG: endonuclease III [Bacteroidetes bacterium]|nr:endonuclease III [Bacteroidota bacterium]